VTTALNRYLATAVAAKCPSDQIINFRLGQYCAQPKQLRFHAAARLADTEGGPTQVGYGGARGGAKSHGLFAQLVLDDCQRAPGIKALYLRKVGKQAREQFEDLRGKVLHSTEHAYKQHLGVVKFPNGSQLFIGHFKNESDVDAYLGLEYEVIAIEEATTLTAMKYQALRDSNRTSRDDFRPRIYTSTNPGGVGHAWYKRRYIDPWQDGKETDTRFIFATVEDNAFLDEDYRRKLEENTGWRLRAYRYGDWDIAAGQYFTTWRRDVHVIEPFDAPLDWTWWASMDYGFVHPTVVHLFARDGDGMTYIVDEHYQAGWLVKRQAEAIRAMLSRNDIHYGRLERFVTGADIFAKRGNSETSIAQQYEQHGLKLEPANMDRINGAGQMLDLLGDVSAGQAPRVKVFNRCGRLIECIPVMEHDPYRPEDVMKIDTDEEGLGGDDAYDCARYGLMELDNLVKRQARVY